MLGVENLTMNRIPPDCIGFSVYTLSTKTCIFISIMYACF